MSANTKKVETFEYVYKNYYTWLFHQALDQTLDEELAKDFVEEVFVDLWHKFDHIRQEEVAGLLRRLMRNKLANHFKHLEVVRKYETEVTAIETDFWDGNDDEYEERLRQINEVIDSQPPQRRFIFEQCCLKDKSYKEVAELVGLEVSSIHKHMSRVYAELRTMVKKQKEKWQR